MGIEIKIGGSAAEALQAHQQVEQASEKLAQRTEQTGRKSEQASDRATKGHDETAAAARRHERAARRITEQNETPLERYNRKIAEAKQRFDEGRISAATYNRELARQRGILDANSASNDRYGRTFDALRTKATAAAAAVIAVSRAQQQLRREAEGEAIQLDREARAFQAQLDLTDEERAASVDRALEVSQRTTAKPSTVLRGATEAASQGFDNAITTSEAAIAFLQATGKNADEENINEVVQGFAKELNAGGQKLTAANLAKLSVQVRGLFGETPLQAGDLPRLAQARGVARVAGVSEEEFLGSSAALLTEKTAGEAATGLRNIISILADPGENKALEGLAPDLQRQRTLQGKLGVVGEELRGLPEEERVPFLTRAFGRENQSSAATLIQAAESGLIEENIRRQQDAAEGFNRAVKASRTGLAADVRRAENATAAEQVQFVDEGGITDTELGRRNEQARIRRKREEADRFEEGSIRDTVNEFAADVANGLNAGVEQALGPRAARRILPRGLRDSVDREIERQQEFDVRDLTAEPANPPPPEENEQASIVDELRGLRDDLRRQASPTAPPGGDASNREVVAAIDNLGRRLESREAPRTPLNPSFYTRRRNVSEALDRRYS